ncbi:protein SIEVE ELEMENT OCCLUSION B-like [Cicer arietinum]|uniref:Protein SIEVE ELEMENT OCCLUSION B-like isoform X2 n=1 Tax=Cicer arietinum TaxID=3827 RepID=A0A1S2XX71_CICAR|nr:protein SIEVE ELEMENT OCCLUSION B-like isoform X2 [Cicer arietinum]
MSLSNGAKLPNPFDLNDSQILDKVYLTHLHDDDKCDKDVLFNIVSNVIHRSQIRVAENRGAVTSFQPEFRTLKLISCQMITTPRGERYVHQTTMWILQHLKTYSWDAKALITLAAFTLEYGNLLYLTDISTSDQFVNSLKQLNQIQSRKVPATDLVVLITEVLMHINEWATWCGVGYDTLQVPSLSDALQDIPVAVYWIIASIVAATANIVAVSDYTLSSFKDRLSLVDSKLKENLILSKRQIDSVEEYLKRKKAISNPKNIVDFLKLLIQRNGDNLLIYDGNNKTKTDIEVFKEKYVLLFISSLNKVEDEILLLNSIYERLHDNPQEVIKGYKKEDFKILWIPICDDEGEKIEFNSLKNKIRFYAVEYLSKLSDIRFIREILNYRDKPIVLVLNPLGEIMNEDAMNLIFQWGIDAFPFRNIDGYDLTQKWKWFWDVTKRVNLGIQVKGDRYIFIYGGGDKKWTQDFTLALEKTKRHETILRADAIIEHYQLGKDDPKIVPRFWIEIESKRLKKHQDALDCEIQDIVKSLLCLKQDLQGWAILTKGYNVKILGHGEPMYQTLADFDVWKDKVLQKEGFDIAFQEYYDTKVKETRVRPPCEIINVDNNINGNVIATISCPNPTCGRVMEVSSVNYKCCHNDDAPHNGKI